VLLDEYEKLGAARVTKDGKSPMTLEDARNLKMPVKALKKKTVLTGKDGVARDYHCWTRY